MNEEETMKILGIFFVLYIIAGSATKHASFILLYGSIFDWLRDDVIKKRKRLAYTRPGAWFWKKAYGLFTCNLCMTAQVAIWMCALPASILLHWRWAHPLEQIVKSQVHFAFETGFFLFIAFVVSMAVASLAMLFWNIDEYFSKKAEAVSIEPQIQYTHSTPPADKEGEKEADLSGIKFTLSDFRQLIKALDEKCVDIGCGSRRKKCRTDKLNLVLHTWAEENNMHNPIVFDLLMELVGDALAKYFSDRRSYGTDEYPGLEKQIYDHTIYPNL